MVLQASAVILPQLTSQNVTFDNVQNAVGADLQIRLFGKPEIDGSRRLGVALATAESVVDAIERREARRRTGKSTGLNPGKKTLQKCPILDRAF
ncbi:phosphoribosylglycinamide formyltransferase 2 [Escherichia coli]|uniref:Phosphoribosylglycinamide formyltransferase 2 n=1 Tax=Escherichia coli TaxID=562 RepID=A0A376U7X9_ECOLX|nr:phosphoribosylglycinamide formyltransferase 2 [Escherichia coli]